MQPCARLGAEEHRYACSDKLTYLTCSAYLLYYCYSDYVMRLTTFSTSCNPVFLSCFYVDLLRIYVYSCRMFYSTRPSIFLWRFCVRLFNDLICGVKEKFKDPSVKN